jgi:hypothetical protein
MYRCGPADFGWADHPSARRPGALATIDLPSVRSRRISAAAVDMFDNSNPRSHHVENALSVPHAKRHALNNTWRAG